MGRSRDVIGGVVDIFGRGIEPSVFADMKNAVGDIAGNGNIRWKANLYGPVGFLFGGREERLCEYGEEGRRLAAVLCGQIDNTEELCGMMSLESESSPCGLAVSAYSLLGEGFADRIKGKFAFAVYDEEHGRLAVTLRGRGIAPIYYLLRRERLVFSSHLEAVLAFGEPREVCALVDGEGLVVTFGKCERVTIDP